MTINILLRKASIDEIDDAIKNKKFGNSRAKDQYIEAFIAETDKLKVVRPTARAALRELRKLI